MALNTAAKAFLQLQAKGLIVVREQSCLGITGAGKGPRVEMTELATPNSREGKKLYKQCSKRRAFRVVKATASNPTGKNRRTKSHRTFEDDSVIEFETLIR